MNSKLKVLLALVWPSRSEWVPMPISGHGTRANPWMKAERW